MSGRARGRPGWPLLPLLCLAASSCLRSAASRPQTLPAPYSRPASAGGASFHFRSPKQNAQLLQQHQQQQQPARRDWAAGPEGPLLWRHNGRLPVGQLELERYRAANLFQCDEPSRRLFEDFVRQYNRSFADASEKLERLNLFALTLKRAILFNRVIQHEILKPSNYEEKTDIRNYHFVEATRGPSFALWLADITDCELGLIKKTIFDIFYHLDSNDYAEAYRVLELNRDYLAALWSEDGFEQLANILLVRLFDRFRGDQKMNQLFAWPLYMKRLAAFVYNQRQARQPGHKTKMALVSFAYPAYFKDLKYNLAAINRTADNVRANQEHELFFGRLERRFASVSERNRRLAVFRQRWSLIGQLNGQPAEDESLLANRSRHASQLPDWLRVQLQWDSSDLPIEYNVTGPEPARGARLETGERELAAAAAADQEANSWAFSNRVANGQRPKHFRLTQFSDLTDLEFVAFLSNDFSLLERNSDSADYIERNFPVRPLDSKLRWELAHELELRRGLTSSAAELQEPRPEPTYAALRLAKQVVDELISDVGLPIGPASLDNIEEAEHYRLFDKLARLYQKPYAGEAGAGQLSHSDLADERQRRYLTFKQNYGRFRAWMIKEAWQLDEAQLLTMLRLADMSWLELKLTLFRVCCLSADNLQALSATNATIQYLGANYDSLCQPMTGAASSETAALELYYYYSVHFNKHHSSQAEFARRFDVFRRNLEAVRRHSCLRSLTLYESLRLKRPDTLSTMDVIDPRRGHTDDLNLDRFEYFRLPAGPPPGDLVSAPGARPPAEQELESGRAPISYRRDHFASLLNARAQLHGRTVGSSVQYADKLLDSLQDSSSQARSYSENRAGLVYELVLARYKFCMKNYENIDLDGSELRQQCQANGPLADGAGKPLGGFQFDSLDPIEGSVESPGSPGPISGRLRSQTQRDRCAYYRQGLEPWSAGLVRQDERSVELIRQASCA